MRQTKLVVFIVFLTFLCCIKSCCSSKYGYETLVEGDWTIEGLLQLGKTDLNFAPGNWSTDCDISGGYTRKRLKLTSTTSPGTCGTNAGEILFCTDSSYNRPIICDNSGEWVGYASCQNAPASTVVPTLWDGKIISTIRLTLTGGLPTGSWTYQADILAGDRRASCDSVTIESDTLVCSLANGSGKSLGGTPPDTLVITDTVAGGSVPCGLTRNELYGVSFPLSISSVSNCQEIWDVLDSELSVSDIHAYSGWTTINDKGVACFFDSSRAWTMVWHVHPTVCTGTAEWDSLGKGADCSEYDDVGDWENHPKADLLWMAGIYEGKVFSSSHNRTDGNEFTRLLSAWSVPGQNIDGTKQEVFDFSNGVLSSSQNGILWNYGLVTGGKANNDPDDLDDVKVQITRMTDRDGNLLTTGTGPFNGYVGMTDQDQRNEFGNPPAAGSNGSQDYGLISLHFTSDPGVSNGFDWAAYSGWNDDDDPVDTCFFTNDDDDMIRGPCCDGIVSSQQCPKDFIRAFTVWCSSSSSTYPDVPN